jgi:hypothetical protein
MPAKKQSAENPLLGKNIPPAPPPSLETPEPDVRLAEYQGIREEQHQDSAPGKEHATVELSLYLRPSQDDKLEDLRRDYKRLTGKKISANEVIRRLIERATLENLL